MPADTTRAESTSAGSSTRPDSRGSSWFARDAADERYDAVLRTGPLYHLAERRDGIAALLGARRVLRRDGVPFAAAISRHASLFDGLRIERFADPAFAAVVERDLDNGQHRNEENLGWCRRAAVGRARHGQRPHDASRSPHLAALARRS